MSCPKVAVCVVCVGEYSMFFREHYETFKDKFLTDCDRTFFVFTDNPWVADGIDDCVTYEICHACRHIGFNMFRKFKHLMMAEDRFLDFDLVAYADVDMKCVKPVELKDVDPGDNDISVIWHVNKLLLCGLNFFGSLAFCNFDKPTKYLQAGFFVAKSGFFLVLANLIESMRCYDKAGGNSRFIPYHDESYYNSALLNNGNKRVVEFGLVSSEGSEAANTAVVVRKKPFKPSYDKFKGDLY